MSPVPAEPASIPALAAPPPTRDNPLTRSIAGIIGIIFLVAITAACLGSLPYTLGVAPAPMDPGDSQGPGAAPGALGSVRYNDQRQREARLPPFWWYPGSDDLENLESAAATGSSDAAADLASLRDEIRRYNEMVPVGRLTAIAAEHGLTAEQAAAATRGPAFTALREAWPRYWLGSDRLGRSLMVRCMTGGGISLGIGLAAAALSVLIGTLYGSISAYAGGKTDAVMMRIVDVLYGLPYVLLVVLLAVASDAAVEEYISHARERSRWTERVIGPLLPPVTGREREELLASPATSHAGLSKVAAEVLKEQWLRRADPLRPEPWPADAYRFLQEAGSTGAAVQSLGMIAVPPRDISATARTALDATTLLVAIGGVSWLTMARVIRGQVLSLKSRPFMEAARAIGVPWHRQFTHHLLPNLLGPIIVYATLTVPQAILQESFLSFLGIGVKPPLPSWGNLAAEGLGELNEYKSHWWMLVFPCALLGTTLLALNFVGEGLREAMDPRRARR